MLVSLAMTQICLSRQYSVQHRRSTYVINPSYSSSLWARKTLLNCQCVCVCVFKSHFWVGTQQKMDVARGLFFWRSVYKPGGAHGLPLSRPPKLGQANARQLCMTSWLDTLHLTAGSLSTGHYTIALGSVLNVWNSWNSCLNFNLDLLANHIRALTH